MKFEEELTIENRARQSKRQSEFIRRETNGENIYTLFWVWCQAYKENTDEKTFRRFLKQENKTLNFWQEKYLNEKYFGYKYTYDNKNQKWEIVKL